MLIEYKNVNVWQEDQCVLSDVNFHVDDGEFIYIIGKVGSGKSSLLKTIYCELDIEEGDEAMALGRDLLHLRRREIPALRKEMGIIFQDFQLLSDRSVRDNLRFVLRATSWKDKNEIDERIDDVLGDVGMQEKGDSFPHELSGGEQQRIAIARAILNKPKVIIADEPTGNLDMETAHQIIELLRRVTQMGTAVVMTTHNTSLLKEFPGIVYRCINQRLEDITDSYNKMALYEDEEDGDDGIEPKKVSDYSDREDLSI